jgi:hypothetical protein
MSLTSGTNLDNKWLNLSQRNVLELGIKKKERGHWITQKEIRSCEIRNREGGDWVTHKNTRKN